MPSSDDITNIQSKHLIQQVGRKIKEKSSEVSESTENESVVERKDIVELSGSEKVQESAQPKVDPEKMAKYLEIVQNMPDVREDEVARIHRILSEDGYGQEAIEGMLDSLLEDL